VLRYFFDFVSADVTIRDATGAELPDLAAAHARAVRLAYQIDDHWRHRNRPEIIFGVRPGRYFGVRPGRYFGVGPGSYECYGYDCNW